MDIELTGLTVKQKMLCDIMWSISTKDGVNQFVDSLPQTDQRDCRCLIELMQLAFLDEVSDTQEADKVIKSIVDRL